jgi:hypothetical protein
MDSEIRSTVNRGILKKYCNEFPGCSTFLENFFTTCEPYSPLVNFMNYLNDLRSYSTTNRHIRDNEKKLVDAFFDIVEI